MCRTCRYLSVLLLVFGLAVPATGASGDAEAQIAALMAEKRARTPAERKISSSLLVEHKRRAGDPALRRLSHLRPPMGIDAQGRLMVDLDGEITPGLEARVVELGGRVSSAFPHFRAARLEMPLDRLVGPTPRTRRTTTTISISWILPGPTWWPRPRTPKTGLRIPWRSWFPRKTTTRITRLSW